MNYVINSLLVSWIIFTGNLSEKHYQKYYYDNGVLKAEGWMQNQQKVDYWFEYDDSGNLKSQGSYNKNMKSGYWYYFNKEKLKSVKGHYKNGLKTGWWLYLHKNGSLTKIQFSKNKKDGLVLYYEKNKSIPYKAERYKNGKFLGVWTSLSEFKRDNPNLKL